MAQRCCGLHHPIVGTACTTRVRALAGGAWIGNVARPAEQLVPVARSDFALKAVALAQPGEAMARPKGCASLPHSADFDPSAGAGIALEHWPDAEIAVRARIAAQLEF